MSTTNRNELNELLDNIKDLYSEQELQKIRAVMEQLSSKGKKRTAKLVRPIVPIREWLESEYYLGPFAHDLYPYWKEQLINIFESPVKVNEVILTGATGCLKTDTLYSTTEGFKTLKDLNYKDFSIRSETSEEKAKVTDNHFLGVQPTKIVTLENGTVLEGTLNHRIKVLRNNKVEWARFDNLEKGDIIIHSRLQEPFGTTSIPADLAYIIGYIIGDGHVKKIGNSINIGVALQKTQNNYQEIYDTFEKYYGKPTIDKDSRSEDLVTLKKQNIEFNSLEYLESINSYAKDKYLCDFLLSLNYQSLSLVLKGLFDADSGISRTSANIELTLASEKLVNQVKRILAAYGINSKLTTKYINLNNKRFKAYRLNIRGQKDLKLFKQQIGYNLDYKAEILEDILSTTHRNQRTPIPGLLEILREHDKNTRLSRRRLNRFIVGNLHESSKAKTTSENIFEKLKEYELEWLQQHETLKYFVENDVYTVRVKSIKDSEAEVGDIEVPTTHFYNIGGIVSHNTGKTYAATIIMMRRIYELSCYEGISSLFPNLSSISRIAMAYLSVTATQAKQTGFHTMRELFDSVPYFNEIFPRNKDIDSMLVWNQENFFVTYGSRLNHFIGLDLLGSTLDEANFYAGREVQEKGSLGRDNPVYLLYDQIVSRAHSRFVTKDGNDALSIIASSATIASSFTEERIRKGLDDPSVYICSPALWDVRPGKYSGERFYVFAGSETVDPLIIDSIEDLNSVLDSHKYTTIEQDITIKEALQFVPTDIRYRTISVPIEHRSAFKTNITFMLQDLAGFSVASSNKFFTSKKAYEECIDNDLIHPFTKDEIILSTTKEQYNVGGLNLMDYFRNDLLFKNPNTPRFMHLDLALTGDSVGIAMVHISNWKSLNEQYKEIKEKEPERYFVGGTSDVFEASLNVFSKTSAVQIHENELKLPIITVDFMLRINPPPKPESISFSKIRDFIIWLKYVKKVNIQKVTFDQFQSAQMRQELEEAGITTGYLSVDRTSAPYDTLRNLMQDYRVKLYPYESFRKELFGLIETRNMANKTKIDHPKNGSKDVSDAVAGAVYTAVDIEDKTDTSSQSLNEVFVSVNTESDLGYNIQTEIDNLMNILKK